MYSWCILSIIIAITVKGANSQQRIAIAHLVSENVTGSITFTETDNGVHVSGVIEGLTAGNYGFHVHELGDTSTCDATGGHFNPDDNDHGGRDHPIRHVGDLGNVQFLTNGTAIIDMVDSIIALRDRNNILGRALVLHEGEDDLGQGGDAASLLTGNAGPRVACGVIGISEPLEAWLTNAAPSFTSNLLTFVTLSLFIQFKVL